MDPEKIRIDKMIKFSKHVTSRTPSCNIVFLEENAGRTALSDHAIESIVEENTSRTPSCNREFSRGNTGRTELCIREFGRRKRW